MRAKIKAPAYVDLGAVISPDDVYRHHLWRIWDRAKPPAVFVMLNPSAADGRTDDPTIRKCVGFAWRWGCGSISVVNLFAFRATRPETLFRAADRIGPDNDGWIRRETSEPNRLIVAAWGAYGDVYRQRVDEVRSHIGWSMSCLGETRFGQPLHPLMVPYAAGLRPWVAREAA